VVRCSAYRDSSTGTRTQDHSKDDMVTGARTIDSFGDGKAIRVIRDAHFASERTAQICFHRFSI
jgi:hypothetical protein